MNLPILYEDEDILAINKPAGLVVHSDGRTIEPSVSEWFVEKYPQAKEVGEKMGEIARPGIVHRIDRDTSGALLLVKTKEGHATLKKQFQDHEIEKIYHLFVYGNIKEDEGVIDIPITRSKKDFRKRIGGEAGKEAITNFKVLRRASDKSVTFVEARPKTGRTHQIRAHFRSLYHPLVADPLYAAGREKLLGFHRLALHAREITFRDVKGGQHSVLANYPEDFEQAINLC